MEIDKWLFRGILLLIAITSGSLYTIVFGGIIANILLLSLITFLFVKRKVYSSSRLKGFLVYLGIIVSVVLIHFCITGFNNQDGEFVKLLIRIISTCFLLYIYTLYQRSFIDDLIWVFNLIILHALLNFCAGFIVHNWIEYIGSEVVKIRTFNYLFFYESEASILGFTFYRNQGIFWEPGVLSVYLNLMLFIKIFVKKSSNAIPLYLFLIMTTFSSTGLVIAFIQVFAFYKQLILKNIKLFLVFAVLCLILIPVIINNLQDKIYGESSASFFYRSYDFFISVQIALTHFFTGIGFGEEVYKLEQHKYSLFGDLDIDDGRGNTNSIMSVFVTFGIPLGIFIIRNLYQQTLIKTEYKILFFVVIVLNLSSEPLIFSGIFLLFIFSKNLYSQETLVENENMNHFKIVGNG